MRAQRKQSETESSSPTATSGRKVQREASPESRELALKFARFLDEKQAEDVVILDVSGPLVIADFFVVATARNLRHAQALARELDFTMKHEGRLRRNVAGLEGDSSWVLLDFDDVVVHLFLADARTFYALESLWADVPRVPFEGTALSGGAGPENPEPRDPENRQIIAPSSEGGPKGGESTPPTARGSKDR